MKNSNELLNKILSISEKIDDLTMLKAQQMDRHYKERDYMLLNFLSREIQVYNYTLSELKWVLESD